MFNCLLDRLITGCWDGALGFLSEKNSSLRKASDQSGKRHQYVSLNLYVVTRDVAVQALQGVSETELVHDLSSQSTGGSSVWLEERLRDPWGLSLYSWLEF